MRRWAATAGCAVLLGAALTSFAEERSSSVLRPFWDLAVGAVASDNVYQDNSAEGDLGHDIDLRAGLRKRFSGSGSVQLHYDLAAGGFRSANIANSTIHGLGVLLHRRVRGSLDADLSGTLRLSRFPNMSAFDSTHASARVGLRGPLDSRTTLGGEVGYESHSYPDYDLDHDGLSLSVALDRDLGSHSRGVLSFGLKGGDFSERLVRDSSTPETAAEPRTEVSRRLAVRVEHELTFATQLQVGYEFGGVGSNGELLPADASPGGRPGGISDDERFVGHYHAHRQHALGARLRWLIRRGSSLTVSAQHFTRAYRDWLARDADENVLSPEEKRRDRGLRLSATWDLPVPRLPRSLRSGHFGLRIRLSHDTGRSNDAIYDYGHNGLTVALTSWR